MRSKLRNLMLVSLAVGLFGAIAFVPLLAIDGSVPVVTWVGAAGVVLAFGAIIYIQRHLADGLQPNATARPSAGVFMRNARRSRPLWSLWLEAVLGVLVLVPSAKDIALALGTASYADLYLNFSMAVLGAYLLWDGGMGILERRRAKVGA